MKISEIVKNWDGTFSSRRVAGLFLLCLAMLGKIVLFIVALKSEIPNINELNNICNQNLYTGSTLIGITTIDFFKRG